MSFRSPWVRHGLLNVLEHGVTRVSDGLSSLILIWVIAPEEFSKLALAQAIAAPLLLFFITPENIIYLDFMKWKAEGIDSFARRLHVFRLFGWGKVLAVIAFSFLLTRQVQPYALMWAFALALAPQISGIDREFLRVELKLAELNLVNLYQKLSLLAATLFCAAFFPGQTHLLALGAWISTLSAAAFAFLHARRALSGLGASRDAIRGRDAPPFFGTMAAAFRDFSLGQHFIGVIQNWVLSMSLFFMGAFRFEAREVGLFAAVLKIAGLTVALPMALANVVNLWLARRSEGSHEGAREEKRKILSLTGILAAICLVQSAFFILLAPWILALLSRGKWSALEQEQMTGWMRGLVLATTLFGASYPLYSWGMVRTGTGRFLSWISAPWFICVCMAYSLILGPLLRAGAAGAVYTHLGACMLYALLLLSYFMRNQNSHSPIESQGKL